MIRYHTLLALALALTPLAAPLRAQDRWSDIGSTAQGNPVSLDSTSLARTGDVVAAEVRVVYTKPVEANGERRASMTAKATFDCVKGIVDVQEMTTYANKQSTNVIQRGKPLISRAGTPPSGSMWELAMHRICAPADQAPESKSP